MWPWRSISLKIGYKMYDSSFINNYEKDKKLLEALGLLNKQTRIALAIKHKGNLKNHVIERLKLVQNLISEEKNHTLKDMLSFSPAGDEYGYDNYFIDFAEDGDKDALDIHDIVTIIDYFNTEIK